MHIIKKGKYEIIKKSESWLLLEALTYGKRVIQNPLKKYNLYYKESTKKKYIRNLT